MSDTDTVVRINPGARTLGGGSALVVVPVRLFLAVAWIRSGVEKVIEANWWRGRDLRRFVDAQHDAALSFFRPFLDEVVVPFAPVVAAVVALAQLVVGVAILTGWRIRPAIAVGVTMNVSFVLAGVVNPSVFYLVMQGTLLLGLAAGALTDVRARPARWTLAVGAAAIAAAAALVPHVRTLDPDRLIADPAAVLVLLSLVIAATVAIRWSGHLPFGLSRLAPDADVVRSWVEARGGEHRDDARPAHPVVARHPAVAPHPAMPVFPAVPILAPDAPAGRAIAWAPPVAQRPVEPDAPPPQAAAAAGTQRP